MKCLRKILVTIPMASMMMFAQQADPAKPADNAAQPAGAQATTPANSAGQAAQPSADRQPATQADRPSAQASQSTTQSAQNAGQSGASSGMTYKGTIVNAECSQASALTSSRSANYADRTSAAGADASAAPAKTMDKNQKSVYDMQHDVMRHCPANAKATSFALLTDDGRFLKLDDAGNNQVKGTSAKSIKNMKVTVTGSIDGETLKVQSLSQDTSKT